MKNENRTARFKKNNEVEDILALLDKTLSDPEGNLVDKIDHTNYPTIFVFGCARSGTTVVHQHLIQNLKSIYPSNFISRFFYAPYIGGLLYKLFTDLDKNEELLGGLKKDDQLFSSNLGKTKGVHSPNEFWYFWRKHFPINTKGTIDVNQLDEKGSIRFKQSIYALQNLFEAPFVTKGMIANNCIDFLEQIFPKAIFIYIKRDTFANAKSLYQARLNYFKDPKQWYSFYPKDPLEYSMLTPEEQVVKQVIDTNEEIETSLKRCQNNRMITVNYEEFCKSPKSLLSKLQQVDDTIELNTKTHPDAFEIRENKKLGVHIEQLITQAIKHYS